MKDKLLCNLVKNCNDKGVSFSITLNVGGLIISGTLISSKNYSEILKEQFAKNDSENVLGLVDILSEFEEECNYEVGTTKVVDYIHLMDCQYYLPVNNRVAINGGILWRGEISSVNSFNMHYIH